MATVAHCLYCFDVLAASLERRDHLSLHQIEQSWAKYQGRNAQGVSKSNDLDDEDASLQDGDEIMLEGHGGLEDSAEEEGELPVEAPAPQRSSLRLPSISRLQAPSPASGSTSSTPSTVSASSSRLGLDEASSKTSSKTSIFSFGQRSHQPSPAAKEERYPLFVTWNTVSARGNKSLRGCIGTFEAQDLSIGLKSYALTAAFDDTRFSPIALPELSSLSTHITLLHTFTPCSNPFDWTLGTHGLRISFSHRGRRLSATYLPDVAIEQGWTKEETIISLMRKAGWSGRSREWSSVNDLKAVRYEGKGEGCGWALWREWRDWVEESGL